MPKGVRVPKEIREAVVRDYYDGKKTTEQIALEYGVGRRRIYDWVEQSNRGANKRQLRRGIRLTLDETELLLIVIAKCDKLYKGATLAMLRAIENRLLDVSDELTALELAAVEDP